MYVTQLFLADGWYVTCEKYYQNSAQSWASGGGNCPWSLDTCIILVFAVNGCGTSKDTSDSKMY